MCAIDAATVKCSKVQFRSLGDIMVQLQRMDALMGGFASEASPPPPPMDEDDDDGDDDDASDDDDGDASSTDEMFT